VTGYLANADPSPRRDCRTCRCAGCLGHVRLSSPVCLTRATCSRDRAADGTLARLQATMTPCPKQGSRQGRIVCDTVSVLLPQPHLSGWFARWRAEHDTRSGTNYLRTRGRWQWRPDAIEIQTSCIEHAAQNGHRASEAWKMMSVSVVGRSQRMSTAYTALPNLVLPSTRSSSLRPASTIGLLPSAASVRT
jgi:hypothetical protein